jgi:hypothetical protein
MKWKCLVVALLSCSAAHAQLPSLLGSTTGAGLASTQATVSANLAITGPTIPLTFIGISTENQDLINGFFQGTTGNAASFIGLANLLGANGYLRIGGGSADFGTPPALTAGICTNLASFVAGLGAGWKVIYTLDAVANNSATAATQAGLLATALGATKVIFQYGNEPVTSGHFNTGTYTTMWNAYQTAVVATVPSALVAAPDDGLIAGNGNQTEVASLSVAVSAMSFVTLHSYEYGSPTTLTNASIPISNWRGTTRFQINSINPWAGVTNMRVTEGNMISNKGQAGMTDRLMHAAYTALKYSDLAKLGWGGYDTHNFYAAPQANYNSMVQQVDGGFSPGASFYAQYLFSKLLGQTIVNSSVTGNISAICTQRVSGKANCLVVNLDQNNATTLVPSQSSASSTANVLQANAGSGNGCTDSIITVGGQSIGEGGTWSGAPFSINSGSSIRLGPCEIAEIEFQ